MAKDKESFLLYKDQISSFEKMTDEEAGRLIKHIYRYVNDQNPEPIDRMTEMLFEPIKQTLKRDLKKYVGICKSNSERGKLGGRPPKAKKSAGLIAKAKNSAGLIKKAKIADSDSDSDSDLDTEKKRESVYRSFRHLSLSILEFKKLELEYTKEQIDDTIDSIENYKLNKNYISLNLTVRKWLKKDKTIFPKGGETKKPFTIY